MKYEEQESNRRGIDDDQDDSIMYETTHESETNAKRIKSELNLLGLETSEEDMDSSYSPASTDFQRTPPLHPDSLDSWLPEREGDPRDGSFNMLHAAAAKGFKDGVSWELNHGEDIDLRTYNGNTALHLAAKRGWLDIVFLLLVRGAKFDARNDLGQTALHLAVVKGHLAIVTVLMYHGADINSKANDGSTPLSIAREKDLTNIIEFLKWKGAN